jgi:effector-binding domain-containing protein
MAYNIEVVELKPQPVLVIEATVPAPELGEALGRILPAVIAHANAHDAAITGMPFMRYLEVTDVFRIEAGMPVAEPVAGNGEILARELPGGRAATTLFLGPYDRVGEAWDAITAWFREQNLEFAFGGWDVYENDPTEVTDPSELRTRLYQPLT